MKMGRRSTLQPVDHEQYLNNESRSVCILVL